MKKFFGNAVLVLVGIVLPIVVVDVTVWFLPTDLLPSALRNLKQRMEASQTPKYWRADAYLRSVIRPGTDAMFVGDEFSFRTKTHLNFPDAGFRGGSLGGPIWGIAVGDSFTFGCCVNQGKSWVTHLANLAHHEIANLGIPGHGPQQYTRTLEKYGLQLKPKVVFYGLYTNDLADSISFDEWLKGHKKPGSFKRFLKQHSVVYNLLRSLRSPDDKNSRYIDVQGTAVKLVPGKLRDPFEVAPRVFDTAWALTARQIERAIADAKRIDATFVLLYFPSKEEVYWDSVKDEAKRYRSFEEQRGKLSRAAGALCVSDRILCLDLTAALQRRALQRQSLYYPIDIHWNEQGNRAVAEEIYRFLLGKNIV